jgi:integrase
LTPKPAKWEDAVARYTQAKADKMDLLEHDLPRLEWWGAFFAREGIHHLQAITPDVIDRGKAALRAGLSLPKRKKREPRSSTTLQQGPRRTPATTQRYLAVLRHLFQLAVRRWQLLDRNPVLAIDWPKAPDYSARILARAERQRLLGAAKPFLQKLILIALYTGLRQGSILRLEAEDYRREAEVLRVIQKGGRALRLPMTPPLRDVLDSLGVAEGRLFRWPDGRIMHRFPRKAWVRACINAGLYAEKPDARRPGKTRKVPAVRFHDLRHCTGTVLAEAGVPQRIIQDILGHSSGRMTERYTRPRRPAVRRAMLEATRRMGIAPPPTPSALELKGPLH